MKKIYLCIAFCCLFLLTISYFSFIKRTKGFSIKKIVSSHPYQPIWDTGPLILSQEDLLKDLSDQTFSYLGSGKECYAFVSEDDQHVIKFFKQKHMKGKTFFHSLPSPSWIKRKQQKTIKRHEFLRKKTFSSFCFAYEELQAETGIVFLHLNPAPLPHKTFRFLDQKQKPFILNLDKMEFLIQKKAICVFDHIDRLMQKGEIKKAKEAILSLFDYITARSLKGIGNEDNNCRRNLGFIENRAISIDLGEFYRTKPYHPSKREYEEAMEDLQPWLDTHYPKLAKFLHKQLEKQ